MKIFKKIVYCALAVCIFASAVASAGVYFIRPHDSKFTGGYNNDYSPCYRGGYRLNSCPDPNHTKIDLCPANDSYFKRCACDAKYQYTTANCISPNQPQGNACEGKYEACGCPSTYNIKVSDCIAPKVKGSVCTINGIQMTNSCKCPTTYNLTCTYDQTGLNSDVCDGKYKTCKCPSGWVSCGTRGGAPSSPKCTPTNGYTVYQTCANCPAGTVLQGDDCVPVSCTAALKTVALDQCGGSTIQNRCINNLNIGDGAKTYAISIYDGGSAIRPLIGYTGSTFHSIAVIGEDYDNVPWSHFEAGVTVMSAQEFLRHKSNANAIAACGTTVPTLTMKNSTEEFVRVNEKDGYNYLSFKSLNLVQNGTTTNNLSNGIKLTNVNLTVNGTFRISNGVSAAKLTVEPENPNYDNAQVKGSGALDISGTISSTGYDYSVSHIMAYSNAVFNGKSSSAYINFTPSVFNVTRNVAFKYANISIPLTRLGWINITGQGASISSTPASISLYNSSYNITGSNEFYIATKSNLMVGDNASCIRVGNARYRSINNRQIFNGANSQNYPCSQYPSHRDDCNVQYSSKPYINSNGIATTRSMTTNSDNTASPSGGCTVGGASNTIRANPDWFNGCSEGNAKPLIISKVISTSVNINIAKYHCFSNSEWGGNNCSKVNSVGRYTGGTNAPFQAFYTRLSNCSPIYPSALCTDINDNYTAPTCPY